MIEKQFASIRRTIHGARHYFVWVRNHGLFDMSTGRLR